MTETHYTLINRTNICIIHSYCKFKNIPITRTMHNNHGELKGFEKTYGRKLTRMDAIIISPLTQTEIDEIIDGYDSNLELQEWERKEYEEEVKDHEKTFGEPI